MFKLLAFAGVASAQFGTKCFPWRYQTFRLEFFSDGSALEECYEAVDMGTGASATQKFKVARDVHYNDGDAGAGKYFTEYIHDGQAKKYWTIRYNSTKHAVTCDVSPTNRPVNRFCLEANATKMENDHTIAGSTLTETWSQTRWWNGDNQHPWIDDKGGCMVTEYYHIAVGTDIPVTRNRIFHWNTPTPHIDTEHVTYFDVNEHIQSNAFALPSFCPQ